MNIIRFFGDSYESCSKSFNRDTEVMERALRLYIKTQLLYLFRFVDDDFFQKNVERIILNYANLEWLTKLSKIHYQDIYDSVRNLVFYHQKDYTSEDELYGRINRILTREEYTRFILKFFELNNIPLKHSRDWYISFARDTFDTQYRVIRKLERKFHIKKLGVRWDKL